MIKEKPDRLRILKIERASHAIADKARPGSRIQKEHPKQTVSRKLAHMGICLRSRCPGADLSSRRFRYLSFTSAPASSRSGSALRRSRFPPPRKAPSPSTGRASTRSSGAHSHGPMIDSSGATSSIPAVRSGSFAASAKRRDTERFPTVHPSLRFTILAPPRSPPSPSPPPCKRMPGTHPPAPPPVPRYTPRRARSFEQFRARRYLRLFATVHGARFDERLPIAASFGSHTPAPPRAAHPPVAAPPELRTDHAP